MYYASVCIDVIGIILDYVIILKWTSLLAKLNYVPAHHANPSYAYLWLFAQIRSLLKSLSAGNANSSAQNAR